MRKKKEREEEHRKKKAARKTEMREGKEGGEGNGKKDRIMCCSMYNILFQVALDMLESHAK